MLFQYLHFERSGIFGKNECYRTGTLTIGRILL